MPLSSSVSVVIPVRNGAGFVGEAIQSALAQGGTSAKVGQVIVVDNNSTDETRAVVERCQAEADAGSVVLACETRANAANARNAGARLASGEWLAFLDADDVWLPHKLERQMEARARHPEADLFFTLGEEFASCPESDHASRLTCREGAYPMLTPSSLLVRREVFSEVGEMPDVASGEFIAWYGWARELGFRDFVVPEVLVRRRIHAGNSTRAGAAAYPMAVKWLLERRNARRSAGNLAQDGNVRSRAGKGL